MIFGTWNPEKFDTKILQVCPPHLSDVATIPWIIQKVIFNSIIHTYFWLFMLSQKKSNCNPPADPTWQCHHTNLWIAKLFHLTQGLLRSFKSWKLRKEPFVGCCQWLWKELVVMCSNWNVRQAMHSKCSKWPPYALIHASSLFRHWSVALYAILCWNSVHVATSSCRKPQHVHSVSQTQY